MKILAILIALFMKGHGAYADVAQPSFYKISGGGIQKPSYLLGTIHGAVSLGEFPVDLSLFVKQSESVLTEISLTTEEIQRYPHDPFSVIVDHSPFSGSNLDSLTKDRLMQLGIPEYFVSKLSDQDCGVLGVIMELSSSVLPLDLEIIKIARFSHIPLSALDTVELRVAARARNNQVEEVCSLRQIFEAYTPQQILQAIQQQMLQSASDYRRGAPLDDSTLNSPIVTVRNHAWMKVISPEIRKKSVFIAVGQAHLYGSEGVIELLRKQGFTVTKVGP